MKPSKATLERRLRYWQRRLRIEDWRIHAYFTNTFDVENARGQCHIFPPKRQAVIRLSDPDQPDPTDEVWVRADPGEYEWEAVLIHELLHVRFAELAVTTASATSDDDLWKPWEPVIHALAMALRPEGAT